MLSGGSYSSFSSCLTRTPLGLWRNYLEVNHKRKIVGYGGDNEMGGDEGSGSTLDLMYSSKSDKHLETGMLISVSHQEGDLEMEKRKYGHIQQIRVGFTCTASTDAREGVGNKTFLGTGPDGWNA